MTTAAAESKEITLHEAFGVLANLTPDQRANLLLTDRERYDLVETLVKSNLDELGATGTTFSGGFLDSEEYNSELSGQRGIEIYRRMAMSDGTVKAMLRILTLPMRAAELNMDAASDDPQDMLIAAATQHALKNMPGMTWDNFTRQALVGASTYGFAVFEPVYETPEHEANIIEFETGGENSETLQILAPYKIAPRLQKTIYRFLIDELGELLGIQQLTYKGTMAHDEVIESGDSQTAFGQGNTGTQKYITIPIERLFMLTFDQDGSNYRGESILRTAYKHWYYKDNYMRILSIGLERHMVGVPYAILRQGISPIEQSRIIAALRTLRSHEKGYIVVNEAQLASGGNLSMPVLGFLDMPTLGANGKLANDAIAMQDRQMVLSILADFLSLGSGMGGNSNVMHRDKTSYFFLALSGYANMFLDALKGQIIKQFVDLNWPGVNRYPTPSLLGLETKDPFGFANSVAQLITAGALRSQDPEIEQAVREALGLPLLPVNDEGDPTYDTDDDDENGENEPDGDEENTNAPVPGGAAAQQSGGGVQQSALNGQQITALLEIIQQVTDGQVSPEAAIAIIKASFPTLPEELITEMVNKSKSFTPKEETPPPLPPGTVPPNRQLPAGNTAQRNPAASQANPAQKQTNNEDEETPTVTMLSEAHCPACNRLVAKNVNVGAELVCRGCKASRTDHITNRTFVAG